MRYPLAFITIAILGHSAYGGDTLRIQNNGSTDQKKLAIALASIGTAYSIALIGLNEAWYKENGKAPFHFFDDSRQWNQVDKLGHAYSAYQISRIGKEIFLWTGMPPKRSALWGAVLSQALMVPIEVLDGYSHEYGFSWSDVGANLAGASIFLVQEMLWEKQKFKLKFSFSPSPYAEMRPEVLGKSFGEQMLKDYNGQTYWLSCDLHGILGANSFWPKWINPVFGYGAEGMVYAREAQNNQYGYRSYRQFYIGIDPDLSYIKSGKRGIRILLFVADMIKLPAPALEYNSMGNWVFHWLYF